MRKFCTFFLILSTCFLIFGCKKHIQGDPNARVEFSIFASCQDTSKLHITFSDSNFNSKTDTATRWSMQPGYISNFFVYSHYYKAGQITAMAWASDTSTIQIIFSSIGNSYGTQVATIQGKGKHILKYTIPVIL